MSSIPISPLDEREYSGAMFYHDDITDIHDLEKIFYESGLGAEWVKEKVEKETESEPKDNTEVYRFSFKTNDQYTSSIPTLNAIRSRHVDSSNRSSKVDDEPEPPPPFYYTVIVIVCKDDVYHTSFIVASPFGALTGALLKTVSSAFTFSSINFIQIQLDGVINQLKNNKKKKGTYDISLLNATCLLKGDDGIKKITLLGKSLLASPLFEHVFKYKSLMAEDGKKVYFETSKCRVSTGSLSLQIDALAKLRFRVSLKAKNLCSFEHFINFISTHRSELMHISDTVPFFEPED